MDIPNIRMEPSMGLMVDPVNNKEAINRPVQPMISITTEALVPNMGTHIISAPIISNIEVLGCTIMGIILIPTHQEDPLITPIHKVMAPDFQIYQDHELDSNIMGVFPSRDKTSEEWEAKERD